MRLNNKVAIVTGAGRGIGRATALLFAKEGAKLVLNDIKADLVKETASLISEHGEEPSVVAGDVANAKDVEALVKAAMERYGRIDILDNNAAIFIPADFPTLAEEEWDRIIDTNVKGTYLCCKIVIPEMIEGGGGSIINLGSIVSFVALNGRQNLGPAYVTSKGAVLQLTRALAVRYGRDNIRVNAVCPGFIETDMVDEALVAMSDSSEEREEIRKAGEEAHALGRFGTSEEVANAVLFLASDESSFITGSPLHVDGVTWQADIYAERSRRRNRESRKQNRGERNDSSCRFRSPRDETGLMLDALRPAWTAPTPPPAPSPHERNPWV